MLTERRRGMTPNGGPLELVASPSQNGPYKKGMLLYGGVGGKGQHPPAPDRQSTTQPAPQTLAPAALSG